MEGMKAFMLAVAVVFASVCAYLYLSLPSIKNVSVDEVTDSLHATRHTAVHSSVHCEGDNDVSRTCVLENVCYIGEPEKVFLIDTTSETKSNIDTLLVYLHTVDKFPQAAVKFDKVNLDFLGVQNFIEGASYLLERFKPDNIMHVLHDDVIPLHWELIRRYGNLSSFPVKIFFSDNQSHMPYDELYSDLSTYDLTYLSNVSSGSVCFRHVTVGYSRQTLWYDYGFRVPQHSLDSYDKRAIHSVVNQMKKRYVNFANLSEQTNHIVLFTRLENRLILNEQEFVLAIAKHFRKRVTTLSLETHSTSEIALFLSTADTLIGMHGAIMTLQIFLRPSAKVLELFPLGINATSYTPYKTLSQILGMKYTVWMNTHRENTVGHSDYAAELGGLSHLSVDERNEIISLSKVRPHLCCNDTSWLYHIYQDTIIEIDEVIKALEALGG